MFTLITLIRPTCRLAGHAAACRLFFKFGHTLRKPLHAAMLQQQQCKTFQRDCSVGWVGYNAEKHKGIFNRLLQPVTQPMVMGNFSDKNGFVAQCI